MYKFSFSLVAFVFFSFGVHAQIINTNKETKSRLNDTSKSTNPIRQLLKKSTSEKLLLDSNKKIINGSISTNAAITKENALVVKEKEQPKAQFNPDREDVSSFIRTKNSKYKIDTLRNNSVPKTPRYSPDTIPNLEKTDRYVIDKRGNSIRIKFTPKSNTSASNFFQEFASIFHLTANDKFELFNTAKDNIGFSHYSYQQYYKGVLVQGGQYLLHEKDGKLFSANGNFYSDLSLLSNATISSEAAIDSAKKYMGAKKYMWEIPEEEAYLKKEKNDSKATFYPKPTLVIAPKNGQYNQENFRLCFKIRMSAADPYQLYDYYIDANTGELVNKISLINSGCFISDKTKNKVSDLKKNVQPQSNFFLNNSQVFTPFADVTANASTLYSGAQTITTDSYNGGYRLREMQRPIQTLNMKNGLSYSSAVDFTNNSTNWNTPEIVLDSIKILTVNNSWEDAFGEQISSGGAPDLFIEITDASGNIIWNKSNFYLVNTFPVIFIPTGKIVLTNGPYLIKIYDYDVTSSNDLLGSFIFSAVSGNNLISSNGTLINIFKSSRNNPALDAHWGMEKIYDFYSTKFGRNSFDDSGSIIKNHINPNNYFGDAGLPNNAFFDPNSMFNGLGYGTMVYGSGDGELYSPLTSLDVVAHEFTHAVVQFNKGLSAALLGKGGLFYQGESGALNESFADIFGTVIEFYGSANPNWEIGEKFKLQSPFFDRSMKYPKSGSPKQPNSYRGTYWIDTSSPRDYGGVHYNSGVQNFWFYLLSNGGTGKVDNTGSPYAVSGIGIDKASQIAYYNLMNFQTENATYLDSYNGSLDVTEILFGNPSAEYTAVKNAWYAVGIGSNPNSYCSGTTNLNAPSGTFTDGSGSNTYRENANCKWVIAPPGANRITINFSKFRTEALYDSVLVYDGPDESFPLLMSWWGNTLPPPITSSVGAMCVRFITDNTNNDSGWVANYTSTGVTPSCSGNSVLSARSGTVSDGSGTANYANNQLCSWLIAPPCATSVTLSFSQFNTEAGYDGVVVYNGSSSSDSMIGAFSGTSLPASVTATSGQMYVVFVSDYSTVKPGFTANYTSTGSGGCYGNTTLNTQDFGILSDGSGANDYCNNQNCTWLIQPPGATSVSLNFTSFNLEEASTDGQSIYDAVEVYDGATVNDPLLGRFSGNSLPPMVTSTSGSLLVRFYSDVSVTDSGWTAYYTSTSAQHCTQNNVLTTASGNIVDGSGTDLYANNADCNWLIQPPGATKIRLNFTQFSTEQDYDGVVVYDGKDNTAPILGIFSGNTIPSAVTSTGGTMFVQFLSDETLRKEGFSANYTSIGTLIFNPFSDTLKVCGDSIVLNAGSGYTSYAWSTGASSQSITVKQTGKYLVTVANSVGYTANDSCFVSILKANIINNDTTICKGNSIKISVDSSSLINYLSGTTGPAGGIVFYDKGNVTNGWRYLESANADIAGIPWWNGTLITTGATATIVGSGLQNTNTIIAAQGSGNYAAIAAKNYIQGGYKDWYLPSKDELNLIYQNLKVKGLGNLNNDFYWSSSEFNVNAAYRQVFTNQGGVDAGWKYFTNGTVRPVRAFAGEKLKVKWSTGDTTNYIMVSPGQTTKYYCTITNGISTCVDSVTVSVGILDTTITALDPLQVCSNTGSVRMQAGVATSYKWLKDGVVIPGATANVYTALQTGNYRVIVVNSVGCTDTSRSLSVSINPLPSGSIQPPVSNIICDGTPILLTASGGNTYQWKLNGVNIPGAIDSSYAAKLSGIYTVTLISKVNCSAPATGSIALTLISKPTVAFSYVNNCVNLPVSFTNTSDVSKSGVVSYAWTFGNGNRSTLVTPVNQIYPTVGNFNIKLIVTPTSCPVLYDSLIKVINIVAPPPGIRYSSMNVLKNVATTLQARNIGTTYAWNPVLGLSNAAISNPIFNFNVGADYQINIVNSAGCKIVDSLLIRVFEKYSVFIPKAFSPDGNGVNDFLRPILVGIKDVKSFRVYSRWGNLLFQTKDVSIGWDGTYNGQLMPTDSYTWVFEGIDLDNKPVISSGKSTLIR